MQNILVLKMVTRIDLVLINWVLLHSCVQADAPPSPTWTVRPEVRHFKSGAENHRWNIQYSM